MFPHLTRETITIVQLNVNMLVSNSLHCVVNTVLNYIAYRPSNAKNRSPERLLGDVPFTYIYIRPYIQCYLHAYPFTLLKHHTLFI